MKKLTLLLLGLALLVAQPVSAQFVPVDAPQAPVDGDHLYFTGIYAEPGPFWGRLSSDPTQPQFSIYCVDKYHYVSRGGDDFFINATKMSGDDSTMGQTRLGATAGAARFYRMTAWLAQQYVNPGTYVDPVSGDVKQFTYANIQNAIWSLTTTLSIGYPAQQLVTLAGGAVDNLTAFDFRDWYVMTDMDAYDSNGDGTLDAGGKQEYITHVAPEPATVLLLLSGLILVGFAARRRLGEVA